MASELPSRLLQVRRLQLTDGGGVDVASVAHELGIPGAPLQRRLSDHGTSFSVVLEHTRRPLAPALLEEPNSNVEQVGFRLGYSEPTAFIRTFQKWYGHDAGLIPPLTPAVAARRLFSPPGSDGA